MYFVGSLSGTVDFQASQSATNTWVKIGVYDAESHDEVEGDTGLSWNGIESHKQYYIIDARTFNCLGDIFGEFKGGSFSVNIDTN